MTTATLNSRELATVLAALRHWADAREMEPLDDGVHWRESWEHLEESYIATDGGEFEPLGTEEIDELCMRLNTEGDDDA